MIAGSDLLGQFVVEEEGEFPGHWVLDRTIISLASPSLVDHKPSFLVSATHWLLVYITNHTLALMPSRMSISCFMVSRATAALQ